MSHLFPMLAQRMFNTPVALHPRKAEIALASLTERLGVTSIMRTAGKTQAFDDDFGFYGPARDDVGYDTALGIACIQVEGMLVQKTGMMRPVSGMTGYDALRTAFLGAVEDPAVRGIVFDINSGGGEISGLFELVDTIYSARGIKPIWAICSDHAYSAAYALASACDRITVPALGGTGSVGVIVLLVDYSRAITAAGLAVHFVTYGTEKAAEMRQMHTGIQPELLDRVARDVAVMGDAFTASVARNRAMPVEAVRAQQADYYLGADGVRAGLADAVMAPDAAFAELLATLG